MNQLYNFCWLLLAQTQPGATEAAGAAGEQAAANPEKPQGLFGNPLLMMAMMAMLVFYFFLMTRGKPKAQGRTDLLKTLKKNDRVLTAGGILGTVVNTRSDAEFVTIRVDDSTNARMQILASSIVRVVNDKNEEESS